MPDAPVDGTAPAPDCPTCDDGMRDMDPCRGCDRHHCPDCDPCGTGDRHEPQPNETKMATITFPCPLCDGQHKCRAIYYTESIDTMDGDRAERDQLDEIDSEPDCPAVPSGNIRDALESQWRRLYRAADAAMFDRGGR